MRSRVWVSGPFTYWFVGHGDNGDLGCKQGSCAYHPSYNHSLSTNMKRKRGANKSSDFFSLGE